VLFFEHKQLYRSVYQDVPVDYYTLPIGKAALIKEGNEVTIIAFGAAVHGYLISNNSEISADLLDLRTLQPLDTEAIRIREENRKGNYLSGRFHVWRCSQRYFGTHYGGML
jgi:pyruvate/2-oxoglutarate/acetoin dehydrogenase E1 component